MRRVAAAIAALLLLGCDLTYTVQVEMPYCPVSDSAWARVDSIPAICVLAKDSTP